MDGKNKPVLCRFCIAAASIFCLMALGSQPPDVDKYFLDLTKPTGPENIETTLTGSGGGTSGAQPDAPLALEIKTLNRKEYRVLDPLICEIRLKNIGAKEFVVPWSTNRQIVYRVLGQSRSARLKPHTLDALLGLEFVGRDRFIAYVASHSLYADMSDSDTYRVLAPGQSASIRFGGPVEPFYHLELPQEFVVTATYDLYDPSVGHYKRICSADGLNVKVVK